MLEQRKRIYRASSIKMAHNLLGPRRMGSRYYSVANVTDGEVSSLGVPDRPGGGAGLAHAKDCLGMCGIKWIARGPRFARCRGIGPALRKPDSPDRQSVGLSDYQYSSPLDKEMRQFYSQDPLSSLFICHFLLNRPHLRHLRLQNFRIFYVERAKISWKS